MKKVFFTLLIICPIIFFSCDKIDNPIPEGGASINDSLIIWDDSASTTHPNNGNRFVLMEEFTGHTCPNCPEGSAILQDIANDNNGSVIPVSIHAGSFAKVKEGDKFTTDFNTESGSEYNTTFSVEFYPSSNVSRIPVNGSYPLSKSRWPTEINKILNTSAIADIEILNKYDDSSATIQTTTMINWKQNVTDPLKLQIFLIESDIIDWQDSAGVEIEDYVHNHVLRKSLTGVWGLELDEGVANVSDTTVLTYNVPANVLQVKNSLIVAFIYKPGPDYEVMQVNEAHITSE